MTEREKQLIDAYIPSPPDPTLETSEYYFLQNNLIIRVFALDVFCHKDGETYGIYKQHGARLVHVDSGWGDDPYHGVYKSQLYDNKEDCYNQTHSLYEHWEALRELQQKEANNGSTNDETR